MKKIVYSVAFFIAVAFTAQAQTPIKETREEVADVTLLDDNLLIYTKKDKEGQFLYTEKKGNSETAKKEDVLNAGLVNTVVGSNPETKEVFVYHRRGRKEEVIAFYTYNEGVFAKTGERKLPKFRNNSYNLGLFLTPDKNDLFISGELARTKGYDDIYQSNWDGKRWNKPKNLGGNVNTRQPEFAPFLSGDSLYFSRKAGEAAYVYAVPFKAGVAGQEPVKLARQVNQENAFNAYYKKQGTQELWITADAKNGYTAYTTGAEVAEEVYTEDISFEGAVSTSQYPSTASEVKANAPEVKSRKADLQLLYGFNNLYLDKAAVKELHTFLEKQQNEARIYITGYSDRKGSATAKQHVSRKRAAYVEWYIKHKLPHKNFWISSDHAILEEQGAAHRKVEIRID
ncbi:OmpA family protein [uncultured Pontibacter sp.]|uniref:OmpA family protein n=1 Tax=uncultured Pontibacter sp. TaxID=453356 RepID=UPI002631967D|nr:OmpA family protein [uncultured Pontibacter sp.]